MQHLCKVVRRELASYLESPSLGDYREHDIC
jgi:hypothetical protein